MRRVVTVIVATIGGLVLLASFHTTPGVSVRLGARGRSALRPPAGGAPPTTGTPTTRTPSATPGPSPSTQPTAHPPTARTTSPAAPPPTTSAPASRTIVGPVVSNRYGDVQVEIVVRNGQLADVEAVELPYDHARSQYISSVAGPELRTEALQARSANIDVISGATYTSQGYAESLQSALDQAGL